MELDQPGFEGYNGVRPEQYPETDYRLAGDFKLPTPKRTYYDKKTAYQQTDVAANSCTIHAAMGAFTDQTGKVFDLEHRKALWNIALGEGADTATGWFVSKAVDAVRKYANTLFGVNMMSFRVVVGAYDFNAALDAGYSVVVGFNGNAAYNMDKVDNDTLDGLTFGASTYGHCVRVVKDSDGVYELVVDNYPNTSKFNTYHIAKSHFDKLVANGVFMAGGYIFVEQADWDAMNEVSELPLWAQPAVEKALKKGLITTDTNLYLQIGDAALEDWFFKLGLVTSKAGNLTLLRYLVVCERLGKL